MRLVVIGRGADVLLVSVPGAAIADALSKVTGISGRVVIDATNAVRGRDESFASLAHPAKPRRRPHGEVVQPQLRTHLRPHRPGADAAGRPLRSGRRGTGRDRATDRDAAYEPVYVGGLEHARLLESTSR